MPTHRLSRRFWAIGRDQWPLAAERDEPLETGGLLLLERIGGAGQEEGFEPWLASEIVHPFLGSEHRQSGGPSVGGRCRGADDGDARGRLRRLAGAGVDDVAESLSVDCYEPSVIPRSAHGDRLLARGQFEYQQVRVGGGVLQRNPPGVALGWLSEAFDVSPDVDEPSLKFELLQCHNGLMNRIAFGDCVERDLQAVGGFCG